MKSRGTLQDSAANLSLLFSDSGGYPLPSPISPLGILDRILLRTHHLVARSSSNNEGSFLWQQRGSFRKNASRANSANANFLRGVSPRQHAANSAIQRHQNTLTATAATATFHGETPLATPPQFPPQGVAIPMRWQFNCMFFN